MHAQCEISIAVQSNPDRKFQCQAFDANIPNLHFSIPNPHQKQNKTTILFQIVVIRETFKQCYR